MKKTLTAEQLQFVEDHYNKDMKVPEIAKHLNVGVKTLRGIMRENGLGHLIVGYRTLWTDEKISWLKENYNLPYKEMCEHLGISAEQIRVKINELGIKRTTKYRPFKIDMDDKAFLSDLDNPRLAAPDIVEKYKDIYGVGESRIHQLRKERGIKLQINTLNRISSAEKAVMKVLDDLDLVYVREKRIGKYSIDLYLGQHLCIEVQGDYWHSKESRIKTDKRKKEFLESKGYSILYIRESEISNAKNLITNYLQKKGLPLLESIEKNNVNASKSGVRLKKRANGGRRNPNPVPSAK